MAYKIAQFRYYGNNNEKNYWPGANPGVAETGDTFQLALSTGEAFNNFTPVSKIGIQTSPGTYVFFNKNTYPVMIGSTGIFELDLDDDVKISYINFLKESLDIINDNALDYLIVDVIYEESES